MLWEKQSSLRGELCRFVLLQNSKLAFGRFAESFIGSALFSHKKRSYPENAKKANTRVLSRFRLVALRDLQTFIYSTKAKQAGDVEFFIFFVF